MLTPLRRAPFRRESRVRPAIPRYSHGIRGDLPAPTMAGDGTPKNAPDPSILPALTRQAAICGWYRYFWKPAKTRPISSGRPSSARASAIESWYLRRNKGFRPAPCSVSRFRLRPRPRASPPLAARDRSSRLSLRLRSWRCHPLGDLIDLVDIADPIDNGVNKVNAVPPVLSAWSPCTPGSRSSPRTGPWPSSGGASACRTRGTPAPGACPFPWPRCVWRSDAR